jgi:hypothetical protein
LAAEVEMERRLRRGIASAARRGWLKRGAPARSRDRRWQFAAAASVVVSVGLVLSVVMPRQEAVPTGSTRVAATGDQRIAASRNVRLASIRGVIGTPDISVSLANAPSELVIEPDVVTLTCEDGALELECPGGIAPQTPQYAEYEMDVIRRHGATLSWRSSRQVPVARNQLSFTLRDPGSLDAGDYDVIGTVPAARFGAVVRILSSDTG